MRITGLERTINNLTSVRQDLVKKIKGPEAEVAELKRQIEVIEDSMLDKKVTIKELDNSLEALNNLNTGVVNPSKAVKKVEEA